MCQSSQQLPTRNNAVASFEGSQVSEDRRFTAHPTNRSSRLLWLSGDVVVRFFCSMAKEEDQLFCSPNRNRRWVLFLLLPSTCFELRTLRTEARPTSNQTTTIPSIVLIRFPASSINRSGLLFPTKEFVSVHISLPYGMVRKHGNWYRRPLQVLNFAQYQVRERVWCDIKRIRVHFFGGFSNRGMLLMPTNHSKQRTCFFERKQMNVFALVEDAISHVGHHQIATCSTKEPIVFARGTFVEKYWNAIGPSRCVAGTNRFRIAFKECLSWVQ